MHEPMRGAWMSRWGAIALAFLLLATVAACDGRTAWLDEPLPDYGPVREPAPVSPDAPRVRLSTDLGDIVLALYPETAPVSTQNFLQYVESGFYDGTQFHRVVARDPGPFMIQGGSFDQERREKESRAAIVNESGRGLSNVRGTLAMARRSDPDSATAGFYINFRDNVGLDGGPARPGYAVFGVVVEGMDVVDRISMTPTQAISGSPFQALPVDPIVVHSARVER